MPKQPPEIDSELARLYARQLVAFASDIPRLGRLEAPDGSAHRESRLCGSRITVDVILKGGQVSDYAHEVDASALGDAAASILARHVVGESPQSLRALGHRMQAMLEEGGPSPDGVWSDLDLFRSAIGYRARYASILLPFQALVAALNQAEQAASGQSNTSA